MFIVMSMAKLMVLHDVVIVDTHKDWMKKEDQWMACRTRCSLFKRCSTRTGTDCTRFGGEEIPGIRD
ncbi:hypothetical protein ACFOU2_10020 [Bacillus songklensis]|uniref:Uncharacterized protein n=1 Tax=Bacillus songklensis TaxID=1069116 RepID=A0ABV8B2H5_9BACI